MLARALLRRACKCFQIVNMDGSHKPAGRFNYLLAVEAAISPQSRLVCSTSKIYSAAEVKNSKESNSNIPSKEALLRIDWLLEHLTPGLLKSRLKPFFDLCLSDLQFEDRLYNYKLSQRSHLVNHIAKIRLYYRYLSPYNKVERIGSCIYEGEDVIVLLWRLSTLESSLLSYLPSFITQKEPKINTVEGALDIHVNKDGHIYRIVNRKITASDREGARVLAKLKTEQETVLRKEEEKKMRRELEDMVEDQKRKGLL